MSQWSGVPASQYSTTPQEQLWMPQASQTQANSVLELRKGGHPHPFYQERNSGKHVVKMEEELRAEVKDPCRFPSAPFFVCMSCSGQNAWLMYSDFTSYRLCERAQVTRSLRAAAIGCPVSALQDAAGTHGDHVAPGGQGLPLGCHSMGWRRGRCGALPWRLYEDTPRRLHVPPHKSHPHTPQLPPSSQEPGTPLCEGFFTPGWAGWGGSENSEANSLCELIKCVPACIPVCFSRSRFGLCAYY